VEAARKSIGIKFAKREIDCLLEQYELYNQQISQLESLVEDLPGPGK